MHHLQHPESLQPYNHLSLQRQIQKILVTFLISNSYVVESTSPKITVYIAAGAGAGGVALLVCAIVIVAIVVRRRKSATRKERREANAIEMESPEMTYGTGLVTNRDENYQPIRVHASYGSLEPLKLPVAPSDSKKESKRVTQRDYIIEYKELTLTQEIGKGGKWL